MKKNKLFLLSTIILLASGVAGVTRAATIVDHAILDGILKANVDADGFVDYAGIRINRGGDLYQYLSVLETADAKTFSEEDKLAFWINAYNAHVIKFVLAKPKLERIDQDQDMFDQKFKIARYNLSLNDIEHRILRGDPDKGGPITALSIHDFDPRIHFALVCGAIDCPKLWNRAYVGHSIKERLQANAENFANNPKYLRVEDNKLVISSLMKWYGKDFDKLGGVAKYLTSLIDAKKRPDADEVKLWLQSDFPAKADFRYDWTLNDIKNKKK